MIDIHTDEENIKFWEAFSSYAAKYKVYKPLKLKRKYLKLVHKLEKKKEEIELKEVFISLFKGSSEQEINDIAYHFRKLSTEYIRLYDGVIDLLESLANNKDYNLYVLSNAQTIFTIRELEELKIKDYFKEIFISSDYGVKKPNLAFFNEAKARSIKANKYLMIGNDLECDILPAISLGFETIFIESNLTPINNYESKLNGFDSKKIEEIIRGINLCD